jgi:hypothetical protein
MVIRVDPVPPEPGSRFKAAGLPFVHPGAPRGQGGGSGHPCSCMRRLEPKFRPEGRRIGRTAGPMRAGGRSRMSELGPGLHGGWMGLDLGI